MANDKPERGLAVSGERRVLFALGGANSGIGEFPLQLTADGYQVETVGIQEALWMWPIEGFDVLLVDATEHPLGAMELCRHVKSSSSEQRVVLMFGDRTGAMPHRFQADAVLSGTPSRDQFLAVVRLLLAAEPAAQRAVPMKAPRREEPAQQRRAG
jgi:DNA-binding response OmpR family regulator